MSLFFLDHFFIDYLTLSFHYIYRKNMEIIINLSSDTCKRKRRYQKCLIRKLADFLAQKFPNIFCCVILYLSMRNRTSSSSKTIYHFVYNNILLTRLYLQLLLRYMAVEFCSQGPLAELVRAVASISDRPWFYSQG